MASTTRLHLVLLVFVALTIPTCFLPLSIEAKECNILQGRWVYDNSPPAYNSVTCPFIRPVFGCQKNGRPDSSYLKFRWQPDQCILSRFDGRDFLTRFRGKKIMFVGDSLMLNQWQSLACLIHSAVPQAKYTTQSNSSFQVIHMTEYDVSIMMQWKQFLVDIEDNGSKGKALKLDHIKGGEWKGIDVLVFYSYGWWFLRKPSQPWDYIESGGKAYKDMNRLVAFKIGLQTWAQWIDQNIDHTKTSVFFQGFSPSHYHGEDWGQPQLKGCDSSRMPVMGKGDNLTDNPNIGTLKTVLSSMRHPAYFLDISRLSLLRPDAHSGIYASPKHGKADCTHWCLPGVPDTWNNLLYKLVLKHKG